MIAVFNPIYPNLKGVIFHHNMVRDWTNYLTLYPRIPVQEPLGHSSLSPSSELQSYLGAD